MYPSSDLQVVFIGQAECASCINGTNVPLLNMGSALVFSHILFKDKNKHATVQHFLKHDDVVAEVPGTFLCQELSLDI